MIDDGLAPVEHDFRIWLGSQVFEASNPPPEDALRQAFYTGWLCARHYSEQYFEDFGITLGRD